MIMMLVYLKKKDNRERLRLTIGKFKVSKEQSTYWSIDGSLRRLLSYRPSIQDMKLILRPMSYLSDNKSIFDDKSLERERYVISLQKRLVEYFLTTDYWILPCMHKHEMI